MPILNIEIKAKSNNQDKVRQILQSRNAKSKGTDHQIDTYFNVLRYLKSMTSDDYYL